MIARSLAHCLSMEQHIVSMREPKEVYVTTKPREHAKDNGGHDRIGCHLRKRGAFTPREGYQKFRHIQTISSRL